MKTSGKPDVHTFRNMGGVRGSAAFCKTDTSFVDTGPTERHNLFFFRAPHYLAVE